MERIKVTKKTSTSWLEELFYDEESGQGLVEYVLILAFVSLACIAALTTIGNKIQAPLNNVAVTLGSSSHP